MTPSRKTATNDNLADRLEDVDEAIDEAKRRADEDRGFFTSTSDDYAPISETPSLDPEDQDDDGDAVPG